MSKRAILCSAISYIPPLFIVGLIVEKNDPVVRYHANQGLLLFLLSIVFGVISNAVRVLGKIFFFFIEPVFNVIAAIVGGALGIIIIVFAIIGIVNALNKRCSPLPVIGDIELIK